MCLTRSNRSSTARSSWCSRRRTRGSWVTSSCLQKFTFIGVTTGQSAATRLFPAWARELGLGDVRLVGCDLPLHAAPERYREVVLRIRADPHERGGLVTTHKIDLFSACRDLFDWVDKYAELCGETSCLAKRDGRLWAFATDAISSERALSEFYPAAGRSEGLCLGAGGSGPGSTVRLVARGAASGLTLGGRTPAPLGGVAG